MTVKSVHSRAVASAQSLSRCWTHGSIALVERSPSATHGNGQFRINRCDDSPGLTSQDGEPYFVAITGVGAASSCSA